MEELVTSINKTLEYIQALSKEEINNLDAQKLQARQSSIKEIQKLTSEISLLLSKEFQRNNKARIASLKRRGPSKLSNAQLSQLVQEQAELIRQLQTGVGGDADESTDPFTEK